MLIRLFAVLFFCSNAFATVYYVRTDGNDTNNGLSNTAGGAWLTIGKAATVLVGGDTVNIGAGTFPARTTETTSGTAGNPITYQGAGAGSTINGGFTIQGAYVTVKNLTMDANHSTGTLLNLSSANADNVIIQNCTLNGRGDSRIVDMRADNIVITGCTIDGNSVASPGPPAEMVYFEGGNNNTVTLCTLQNSVNADAFKCNGPNHKITFNEVKNATNPDYNGGEHLDFFQCFGPGSNVHDIIVEGNYVHDFAGQLGNTSDDNDAGLHDIDFRNNVFVNIDATMFSGVANTRFYNNVFYNVGSSQGHVVNFYNINLYTSTGSQFRNNVVINTWSNGTNGTVASNAIDINSLTITHNYWAGASFAAKTTAHIGTNAINGGNPNLTNIPTDFHPLASSFLINAGVTLATVTTDKDGISRPQGAAYDIGAYEFSSADTTPPTLISSVIGSSGLTLTRTFSEAVNTGTADNGGWSLSASGGTVTGTYSSGTGTSVIIYDLSRVVNGGETVTQSYSLVNGVEDLADNDLATINPGASVTNNSTQGQVETPIISLASGPYFGTQNVTIQENTAGASVYYTLDGSTPDATDILYTGLISISSNATLRVIGIKSGSTDSAIASATYEVVSWETIGAVTKTFVVPSQTGVPAWLFRVVPTSGAADYVIGLGPSPISAYADMAVSIRFSNTGVVDAISGGTYSALNACAYIAGNYVDVLCTPNIGAHTYAVTATPQGGSPVVIATAHAFRTGHGSDTELDNVGIIGGVGTTTVSNMSIGQAAVIGATKSRSSSGSYKASPLR